MKVHGYNTRVHGLSSIDVGFDGCCLSSVVERSHLQAVMIFGPWPSLTFAVVVCYSLPYGVFF